MTRLRVEYESGSYGKRLSFLEAKANGGPGQGPRMRLEDRNIA